MIGEVLTLFETQLRKAAPSWIILILLRVFLPEKTAFWHDIAATSFTKRTYVNTREKHS